MTHPTPHTTSETPVTFCGACTAAADLRRHVEPGGTLYVPEGAHPRFGGCTLYRPKACTACQGSDPRAVRAWMLLNAGFSWRQAFMDLAVTLLDEADWETLFHQLRLQTGAGRLAGPSVRMWLDWTEQRGDVGQNVVAGLPAGSDAGHGGQQRGAADLPA
jgi:hypothetical protein